MDINSIENQWFSWESWDQIDVNDMLFINVTLTSQIGEFPVGTHFAEAGLFNSHSTLILVDDKGQEHGFQLSLNVGEKVDLVALKEAIKQSNAACNCGHEH